MKRYISSIVIVAVLLLTLGSFYIYSAVSASPYPHFRIEKESGNEREIKSLHISGGYGPGNIHENFDLSLNGTVYSSERSFLDRLDNSTKKMKELQKQYRNFMRGKMNEDLICEDQAWLIYTDTSFNGNGSTNNPFLEISMLNKKSKTVKNSQIPLSKQNRYVRVDNIQLVGKQLKIATENVVGFTEKEINELHVYTVDISNHKLVKDETIQLQNSRTQNEYTIIRNIQDSDVSVPSKYILFNNSIMNSTVQDNQVVKSELIAYNIETSEKEIIKLPKNINMQNLVSFHGDDIYFVTMDSNELKITAYNFKNRHVENVFSKKDTNIYIGNKIAYTIKNGRIYFVTSQINEKIVGNIDIYDLMTGKNLYKGRIVNAEKEKHMNESSLFFYGIE